MSEEEYEEKFENSEEEEEENNEEKKLDIYIRVNEGYINNYKSLN